MFLVIITAYLLSAVLLYFFQHIFIFHPVKVSPDYVYDLPFNHKETTLVYNNDHHNIIQFFPDTLPAKGLVLYFHGNMANVEYYAQHSMYFTNNDYAIWMIDYPGFGKSRGKISEENLYQQGFIFYQLAINSGYNPDDIILYGKSLGSGIAAYVASEKPCKKLILETPYYSFRLLAQNYLFIYPVSLLVKYTIPLHRYIENLQVPVSIIHGKKDEIIPFKHAEMLNASLSAKDEFIILENGMHNDLYKFSKTVKKLDSLLQ